MKETFDEHNRNDIENEQLKLELQLFEDNEEELENNIFIHRDELNIENEYK